MLIIVTDESNLLRDELILRWAKIKLFKVFRRILVRLLVEADVSFKVTEIFDYSVLGSSTFISKPFAVLQDVWKVSKILLIISNY